VEVAQLEWHPRIVAARGSIEQSFRNDLFTVAFGRGFYDGFVATSGDLPVEGGGAPFVVVEAKRPSLLQHRLSVGYLFSGVPAGAAGFSHGVDLRYAHRLGRFFDAGAAAQVGYGSDQAQSLTRFAVMATAGVEYAPIDWLALRADAAIGWQLLSGDVVLGGTHLSGTEGKGLRLEVAGGLGFRIVTRLWVFARGGLAVDGVYPDTASASTLANGFANVQLQLRL
jgi:hypothetical protein